MTRRVRRPLGSRLRAAAAALAAAALAAACSTLGPVIPPRPPYQSQAAAPVLPLPIAAHPRWYFDAPIAPPSWTIADEAKRKPPADGDATVRSSGAPPQEPLSNDFMACDVACSTPTGPPAAVAPRLGGDYWKTPFQSKPEGCCWIVTAKNSAWRGQIDSPRFRAFARYLHFKVHFDRSAAPPAADAAGRVELLVDGEYTPRKTWRADEEVSVEVDEARAMRLRIVDDSAGARIAVKDIFTSDRERDGRPAPVFGLADLHAHFFSNIGFGGRLFHGRVHSGIDEQGNTVAIGPSDPKIALSGCTGAHLQGRNGKALLLNPQWNHLSDGPPSFNGWPRFNVLLEQQSYVDWIRRAHAGGVRLVQVDVVNSRPLTESVYDNFVYGAAMSDKLVPNNLSDAWNIEHQIRAAHALVQQPDVKDWAGIASTPAEARALIRAGKMALVLGVEVDDLGSLTELVGKARYTSQLRATIRTYVARIRALGVRHVIPIHLADNGFGGSAIYDGLFDAANVFLNQQHFALRNGEIDGIHYRLDHDTKETEVLSFFVGLVKNRRVGRAYRDEEKAWGGHANAMGLTGAGHILLEELMRAGLIIDVDHMSDRAVEQTLCVAESQGYPLIASHTGFRELAFRADGTEAERRSSGTHNPHHFASERARTRSQLDRIVALGGMLGVGTGRTVVTGDYRPLDWVQSWDRLPAAGCDGTTVTFAKQYLYALEATRGRGIAIGTDVNGFAEQSAPRFGPFACLSAADRNLGKDSVTLREAQAAAQRDRVLYRGEVMFPRGRQRFEDVSRNPLVSAMEQHIWQALVRSLAGEVRALSTDPLETLVHHLLQGARGRDGRPISENECGPVVSTELCATVCSVLNRWTGRADRSETPRDQAPLEKSRITVDGRSTDFDYNLDGLAHYGLLPDLLQDMTNLGVTPDEMAPLFRSADDYLATWETIEERRASLLAEDPTGLGDLRCPIEGACACGVE